MSILAPKKLFPLLGTVVLLTLSGCNQQELPANDQDLEFKVKTAYVNDPELFRDNRITIKSENGVILLSGSVPDQKMKDRMEELAKSIKEIKGVKNDIDVRYVFTEKP